LNSPDRCGTEWAIGAFAVKTAGPIDVEGGHGLVRPHTSSVVRPVRARRDGRTDRARADDSNAYAHLREAIALPFIQKRAGNDSQISCRR
jgi:hypothetical protein